MIDQPITIFRGVSFGPLYVHAKDTAGAPYNLTGWSSLAQVRRLISGELLATLSSVISDAPNGIITVTLDQATTTALAEEVAEWDLVLVTNTSVRLGPFIGGQAHITDPITIFP